MAGKIVNKLLGSRVKAAREGAGLSQPELASRSGIGQSTIAEIEAGRIRRPKKLRELAEALQSSETWLLGETHENVPLGLRWQYNGADLVDAPRAGVLQPGMFRPMMDGRGIAIQLNTLVPKDPRLTGTLSSYDVAGNDQAGIGAVDRDVIIAADFVASKTDITEPMLVVVGRSIDGTTMETSLRKVVLREGKPVLSLGEKGRYQDIVVGNFSKTGQTNDQHGYTVRIFGIAVRLTRQLPISKN